jgi:hypothetical protein
MEINYVCSLGSFCHAACYLKDNKLQHCSYPFDYAISAPEMITDCLRDDFKLFLDRTRHVEYEEKGVLMSNHKLYGKFCHIVGLNKEIFLNSTFRHHNITKDKDYNSFVRKVERFRMLLKKEEPKLFLLFSQDEEYTKKEISELNDMLKTKTTNYQILCVTMLNDFHPRHTIEEVNNIKFVKLYTYGRSNGGKLLCHFGDEYLDKLIKSQYNFQLKDDIKLDNGCV